MKRFLLFALLFAATSAQASRAVSVTLVNEAGLTYNTTYAMDVSTLKSVAMSAVYSSVTFNAATFTDGAASTGSITVVSTQPLVGVAGTDTLSIVSNTLPASSQFTINGYQFNQGGDWTTQDKSSNTAISIKNGVNALSSFLGVTASTPTSTTVKFTCSNIGSFCNAFTMTVNTSSMTVSAHFSGGVDHAKACINGTCVTEGTDWTVVATASGTAKAISDAIVANSTLNTIVTSTWTTGGVVASTSTGVGLAVNYSLLCRPQVSLSCFAPAYRGGTNSAVVTSGGYLNVASHGYTRGLPLLFTKSAGTGPQDLFAGTTYYVVPVDANNFKLATTSAKAVASTNDVRLSTQTATGGGSFTLTPLAYTGTAGFFWEASNDNSNYNPVSVSSVTYSSPSSTPTSTLWDLGDVNFGWLRLNATAPTQGGMSLVVTVTGRAAGNKYRP